MQLEQSTKASILLATFTAVLCTFIMTFEKVNKHELTTNSGSNPRVQKLAYTHAGAVDSRNYNRLRGGYFAQNVVWHARSF